MVKLLWLKEKLCDTMGELEKIKNEKLRKMLERIRASKIIKIEVNDESFQEKVIEQSKRVPVIVDFWAPWCGPCLILSPILERIAEEYKGKFILAKINVDKSRSISQAYSIMSIPSVKLFKDGKVVDEFIGAMPEQVVRAWIKRNIRDS